MYKEVSIKNGKYQLVFQKRIVMASLDPLEITIEPEKGLLLYFKISLTFNGNDKPNVKFTEIPVEHGVGCHIILNNFKNPLGTGLTQPKSIITHHVQGKEKDISVCFFVYKNADGLPIIDFDLYEEI